VEEEQQMCYTSYFWNIDTMATIGGLGVNPQNGKAPVHFVMVRFSLSEIEVSPKYEAEEPFGFQAFIFWQQPFPHIYGSYNHSI